VSGIGHWGSSLSSWLACLAFRRSSLPRGAPFQGAVCGIGAAIGYGLGVAGAWTWRAFADRDPRPPRPGHGGSSPLGEPRGRDVLEAMVWIPFVTFWQVTVDLPLATGVPVGQATTYTREYGDGWATVLQPAGLTPTRPIGYETSSRHARNARQTFLRLCAWPLRERAGAAPVTITPSMLRREGSGSGRSRFGRRGGGRSSTRRPRGGRPG
jgi:hypothetical protein